MLFKATEPAKKLQIFHLAGYCKKSAGQLKFSSKDITY